MRRSRKPIVIASRRSALARVQAELVGQALARLHRSLVIEYRWIESEGDRETDRSLAEAGGKGLFTRVLEQALLKGEADLAVHSLKDMPAGETPGLSIAAVPGRAPVNDCLISHDGTTALEDLREGTVIGTSSPRRAAQVLRVRPDLRVQPIRGNVDTRLRKVLDPKEKRYDATLLAAAGLQRLGLTHHASMTLPIEQMLPAACQGALGIQCRSDDHVTLTRCLPLNDPTASAAAHAERWVVAALEADCHSPLAVLAEPIVPDDAARRGRRSGEGPWFRLRVRVLSADGGTCLEADESTPADDLCRLAKDVAKSLTDRGAIDLLRQSEASPPPHQHRPNQDIGSHA